ncbi:MAG: HlyD family secretion protein, partial [Cyclobacteriaceae bacterium]
SIQSPGIIRPIHEKSEISALRSEIVSSLLIHEGDNVQQGDTLMLLRQEIIDNQFEYTKKELSRLTYFINDLEQLVNEQKPLLSTSKYSGQHIAYLREQDNIISKIQKAIIELNRHKALFEKEIISKQAFDDLAYSVEQLQKEKAILESNKIAQWKTELTKYLSQKDELQKQMSELDKERKLYAILAPISGTIEQFNGIYEGSLIQAGQTIAVISPSTDLIAEIYVSAKDIGYLKPKQQTNIQVDAFNYNQWGMIQGQIISISDDYVLVDNTPVFKVKCKLNKNYLLLKNGIKGEIKKGMTLNARFMIAKRSLFQLLYQKSDDWLNPSRNQMAKNK